MFLVLRFMSLTKIFWSPTWVLNESIFQFGQLEVTDNNFGVLQTIKVHHVLQLYEQTHKGLLNREAYIMAIHMFGLW